LGRDGLGDRGKEADQVHLVGIGLDFVDLACEAGLGLAHPGQTRVE